jgi:predicted transcriptional regulator
MKKTKVYVNLHPSEIALLNTAATIFSSYVSADKVDENNESDMIKKSISLSLKMADLIEKNVLCEEEISG